MNQVKYVIKENGVVIRDVGPLNKEALKAIRNSLARRNLPANQAASLYDIRTQLAKDGEPLADIDMQIQQAIRAGTLPYISRQG